MALPPARLEHELPGRVRLRVPSRAGDKAFFDRVQSVMAELPGLRSVRANAYSGGVVIRQTGGIEAVGAFARDRGLFDLLPQRPQNPRQRRSNPGNVPLRSQALSFAAGGLAGLGVYQATRGRVLGNAAESLWNSYRARAALGMPWTSAVLAGAGLYQLVSGPILGSATSLLFYALNARAMARSKEPTPRL